MSGWMYSELLSIDTVSCIYIAEMPDNKLYLLLLLPLLLRLTKSKRLPKRETIIPSKTERVLLLGASSGVGRELALEYAKRGARV